MRSTTDHDGALDCTAPPREHEDDALQVQALAFDQLTAHPRDREKRKADVSIRPFLFSAHCAVVSIRLARKLPGSCKPALRRGRKKRSRATASSATLLNVQVAVPFQCQLPFFSSVFSQQFGSSQSSRGRELVPQPVAPVSFVSASSSSQQ
jgi:hypothetical protein